MCILLVCMGGVAFAQKADTANKIAINILQTKNFVATQTDSGTLNKFIGDVQLQQGTDIMYCDSAYLNQKTNNLEAFDDVRIVQTTGTEIQSDYLRYTGNKKEAFLKGNVSLTDGKSKLWCEELTYDLSTKIGTYDQGGTLQNDTTTVSSNRGVYNVNTKDVRFTEDVIITDPSYNITSGDLIYNTQSKLVQFLAPSIVTSGKSVLHTSGGTYDSKNEIAHFTTRSSVLDDDQFIEADTLDYNKVKGIGIAQGNVVTIDTSNHTTLYCGYTFYNEKTRQLWATIKPVLKQINNNDSLFIRADTFYSAPVVEKDTLKTAKDSTGKHPAVKGKNKKKTIVAQAKDSAIRPVINPVNDTAAADSSRPRFFIGYHHVLIFSDSLQGVCDSISYSQKDSVMKMMYNPIAWSRKSQITGDTILMYMDTSEVKKIYVPNNALIVSQSGPPKAQLFDQVQGKTLTGYFENKAIKDMVVFPNAESIYYTKDDNNAYMGVDQAQCERMRVFFKDQQIDRILYEQDVKHTMTPMEQANIPEMKLSRFQWLEDKRPRSKEELFK